MPHLILLGDSIFDNARYVPGEPDVVRQVQAALPDGWTASLRAVDGATTHKLPAQVARLPRDPSHLVVSSGGNDALGPIEPSAQGGTKMAKAITRLAVSDWRLQVVANP